LAGSFGVHAGIFDQCLIFERLQLPKSLVRRNLKQLFRVEAESVDPLQNLTRELAAELEDLGLVPLFEPLGSHVSLNKFACVSLAEPSPCRVSDGLRGDNADLLFGVMGHLFLY
jgi:hypothetical protein